MQKELIVKPDTFLTQKIKIDIPFKKTKMIKLPGISSRFFVSTNLEEPGFTMVANDLGTDGASFILGPDTVTMISHSTHNQSKNGKKETFTNPSEDFWEQQELYQRLLDQI